jgi:hypothetical protein
VIPMWVMAIILAILAYLAVLFAIAYFWSIFVKNNSKWDGGKMVRS